MKAEAQRIAIAEACGKQHCPNCPDQGWYYVNRSGREDAEPDMEQCQWCETAEESIFKSPDYLNDLNTRKEMLNVLFNRNLGGKFAYLFIDRWDALIVSQPTFCEHFLRVLGNWVE